MQTTVGGWVCWGIQGLGPCGGAGEGISHGLVPIPCVPALPPQSLSQWFLRGFTPWAQWGAEGQTQDERWLAPSFLCWDNAAALGCIFP